MGDCRAMRWEMLFADLEAALDEQERSELEHEVSDRTRIEIGRVVLTDRLVASVGSHLRVHGVGGLALSGQVRAVGRDWMLMGDEFQREHLVSAGAVCAIDNLTMAAGPPRTTAAQRVFERLDRRHAVRGIARDRSAVQVLLADSSTVTGTIDRVGADWFDLTELPAGEFRRTARRSVVKTVPLGAVVCVRS